jgi:hypothetical protein
MNHPPHQSMLNNHVLEPRVNKGADRARHQGWRGAGSPCVVSVRRPSNSQPSSGSTRFAQSRAVMAAGPLESSAAVMSPPARTTLDLIDLWPHHPGRDRRRFLLNSLAGGLAVPLTAEVQTGFSS